MKFMYRIKGKVTTRLGRGRIQEMEAARRSLLEMAWLEGRWHCHSYRALDSGSATYGVTTARIVATTLVTRQRDFIQSLLGITCSMSESQTGTSDGPLLGYMTALDASRRTDRDSPSQLLWQDAGPCLPPRPHSSRVLKHRKGVRG